MQLDKKRQKVAIVILIAVASSCFFITNIICSLDYYRNQTKALAALTQNLTLFKNIYIDIKNIESGQRGYLLTDNPEFLVSYKDGFKNLEYDKQLLSASLSSYEKKTIQFDSLISFVEQKALFSKTSIEVKKKQGVDAAQQFIATGNGIRLMNKIDKCLLFAESYFIRKINQNEYSIGQLVNRKQITNLIFGSLILLFLIASFFWIRYDFNSLKQKEKLLQYSDILINSISDGIITTDPLLNITFWNSIAKNMFGYDKDEVLGKNLIDVLKVKSDSTDLDKIIHEFDLHHSWQGELLNENKYGQTIHVSVAASVLFDSDNKKIGTVSIIRDISYKKRELERLKLENQQSTNQLMLKTERLEWINKATNDAIWDWEINSDKIWGNQNYLNIIGTSANGYVYYQDFVNKIIEEDRIKLSTALKNNAAEKKQNSEVEFRIRKQDNTINHYISRSIYLYNESGQLQRILGSLQDITQQKMNESEIIKEREMSDSIINSLPGVFYIFNNEGKYYKWNENLIQLTGLPLEEMLKVPPIEFIAEKHRPLVLEKISNVFLNGHDVVEANFITKGNIETPYYFTGLRIEYNNEPCVLGVGIDISEKTNYYEQIRLLINHLESIREEERTNISREIHDELGQQLTGIKLDISWYKKNLHLDSNLIDQKLGNTLLLIENSIKSLRKISSRLRPTLLDNFGLISALEWHTEEFTNRYKDITLEFTSNIEADIFSEQDKINIYRIYQECLTNIVKHADATMIDASLMKKNDLLFFRIKDNGKGFDLNKGFKKNSFGIIGIKERVYLLNGKFEIISNNETGTIINIILPLKLNQ